MKGNTLASFDAALDLGVDMIEFDVCAVRGQLALAHNPLEGRLLGAVPLETGLAHLADRFEALELNALQRAHGPAPPRRPRQGHGGEVCAWTCDEPSLIERLTGLDVPGITTDDPRLFVRAASA